jgi:uncharacterized repeat protein (TIGR02543 family)
VPNPTQYGVVWSTAINPTVALATKTAQGIPAGTGAFTSSITGLTAGTLYHVRAYATNSTGTAYGADVTFTTQTTVTFNANGGTGSMNNQSANYNVATALTANAFTRTGYIFSGWNTAANGSGTAYANGAVYPFTANATLYAQWMINANTFADVPPSYWANNFIVRLYNAGVTGGCTTSPLNYCPESVVTRAQMAVFLLRAKYGNTYVPPAATGTMFGDVQAGDFAAAYIEAMANEGITGGCGNGNFCPNTAVTRAQMAVFLLRAKNGNTYVPPAPTGTMFTDVPTSGFAAAYIEALATAAITGGCGGGNFCPDVEVTRAQMAVFLVKTFNLP